MNVVIAGTRKLAHFEEFIKAAIRAELRALGGPNDVNIVSGMAKGPDMFAVAVALADKYRLLQFPPDKSKGVAGFFERNSAMSEVADKLIAFWDGRSGGTKHMIGCMHRLAKPTIVYTYVPATADWDVRRGLWVGSNTPSAV